MTEFTTLSELISGGVDGDTSGVYALSIDGAIRKVDKGATSSGGVTEASQTAQDAAIASKASQVDLDAMDAAYKAADTALQAQLDAQNVTGDFIGSEATFAALPTSNASKTAASGDWAVLTAVDGTNKRGVYIYDGTAYAFAFELGTDVLQILDAWLDDTNADHDTYGMTSSRQIKAAVDLLRPDITVATQAIALGTEVPPNGIIQVGQNGNVEGVYRNITSVARTWEATEGLFAALYQKEATTDNAAPWEANKAGGYDVGVIVSYDQSDGDTSYEKGVYRRTAPLVDPSPAAFDGANYEYLGASLSVSLDKSVTQAVPYTVETELPEDGERWFKSFNGQDIDVQFQTESAGITFRTVPADGSGHIAHAINTPITLSGKAWRAERNGNLITLFEQGGGQLGETLEIGQSKFTFNTAGTILGGASNAAYDTDQYTFEITKDGEYTLDASCLQDITLASAGDSATVGGQFYIGTTAGATDVATLKMGHESFSYDDDNRNDQDILTISEKVKVTLTAGTYHYYMRTADPHNIGGARQAANLRGTLNWIGKGSGVEYVRKDDVIPVEDIADVEFLVGEFRPTQGSNEFPADANGEIRNTGSTYTTGIDFNTVEKIEIVLQERTGQRRQWSEVIDLKGQFIDTQYKALSSPYDVWHVNIRVTDMATGAVWFSETNVNSNLVSIKAYGKKTLKTIVSPTTVEIDVAGIADGDSLVWDATNTKFVKGAAATDNYVSTYAIQTGSENVSTVTFGAGLHRLTNPNNLTSIIIFAFNQTPDMNLGETMSLYNDTGVVLQTDMRGFEGGSESRDIKSGYISTWRYREDIASSTRWEFVSSAPK